MEGVYMDEIRFLISFKYRFWCIVPKGFFIAAFPHEVSFWRIKDPILYFLFKKIFSNTSLFMSGIVCNVYPERDLMTPKNLPFAKWLLCYLACATLITFLCAALAFVILFLKELLIRCLC